MSLLTNRRSRPTDADHTADRRSRRRPPATAAPPAAPARPDRCTPIGDIRWRDHVRVAGRVRSVTVAPWADIPTLECILVDATGGITVVFLGRRHIAGIHPGARMQIQGTVGRHAERLAILNPGYTLLPQTS